MRLITALAITMLTTTACSEPEVLAHQNEGKACHIQGSSIRQVASEGPLLSDPIQPDFESNCGTLPIFVQIFPPVRAEVHRVGLSIEPRLETASEQLSAPPAHSDNPLNPPYTEDVFAALVGASLAKLRAFEPVETSVWQKNDSLDIVTVYVDVDVLEGNWDDALSFVKQRLESDDEGTIIDDNFVDQFGIADYMDQFGLTEYYENSNLKKIACSVARDYNLECVKGSFKAMNYENADYKGYSYKQMLEIPDFGLYRPSTLRFELEPIHNE